MNDLLRTEEDVIALIKRVANEVHDPCGLAQGLAIGIADMGLIRSINVWRADTGWALSLRIRFTSPECLYYFYFEQEIRNRLEAFSQIESIDIGWDEVFDWTPDDLSEMAQSQFKTHHEKLSSVLASKQNK